MSRGNIRPKPSQGQITATSCNVILNAQAHSKSKGKSKAETGSPGVRSLGKEKNTACTQERKLEENGCSSETGVTLIGPSCISANASNKNTEIHDSNNKSTPKHITTSSSKADQNKTTALISGTRTSPKPISEGVSEDQKVNDQVIKANLPQAEAKQTTEEIWRGRVRDSAVCRKFMVCQCLWGGRCHRIHPTKEEMTLFREWKNNPGSNETCFNFVRDRCLWGGLCDRVHEAPNATTVGESEPSKSRIVLAENEKPEQNATHSSLVNVDATHHADSKMPVVENTRAVNSVSSSLLTQSGSTNGMKKVAEGNRSEARKEDMIRKDRQTNHRSKGDICPLTHTSPVPSRCVKEPSNTVKVNANTSALPVPCGTQKTPSTSSQLPLDISRSPISQSVSETKGEESKGPKRWPRRSKQICRRFVEGIKHDNNWCRYVHATEDKSTQVKARYMHPVSDSEESMDGKAPNLDYECGHESFSRTLVDAPIVADTPCVRTPAADGRTKKSSRHRKNNDKKTVDVPKISAMHHDHLEKEGGTVSLTPSTETVRTKNEVVELPCSQRRLSVSTEPDDITFRTNGISGDSFSSDSKISSCSTVLSSTTSTDTGSSHVHDLDSTTKVIPPVPQNICRDWLYRKCLRGSLCKYEHTAANNSQASGLKATIKSPSEIIPWRDAPPPYQKQESYDGCLKCILGLCAAPHGPVSLPLPPKSLIGFGDITDQKQYTHPQNRVQNVEVPSSITCPTAPIVSREPPSIMNVTVLDHTKLKLGAGFKIQGVTTGFESRWLILGNIPASVTAKSIHRVLKPFGQVDDLRMPGTIGASSITIKALFSTSEEAIQASGALNGAQVFSKRITAQLPINNSGRGNAMLRDSSVSIIWDAPSRHGFAGYSSLADAKAVVAAANGLALRGSFISAEIYEGLPTLGSANVRFNGLAPTTELKELDRFGKLEAAMLERPNYTSLALAVKGIQGLLDEFGEVLSFEVFPPPYKDGLVRGWAHFSNPNIAQTVSDHLDGRRPFFIGKKRLSVRHVQAISYTLPSKAYDKLESDIAWLRRLFWTQGNGAVLSVVDRRNCDSSLPIFVKLSGEDVGELGRLKSEFENLLRGEKVAQDGKVAWDGYFIRPSGTLFLHDLEARFAGLQIQKDNSRQTITLFGPISKRREVRRILLDRINRLRAQRTWLIPLEGRLIGLFMSKDLMKLQQSLGHENVIMDLCKRTLTIRGNESAYEAAQHAVHQAQQRHSREKRPGFIDCPVCLSHAVSPLKLQCGHTWCKSCLSNYLVATIDNKSFPLTCLGNEASCTQPISVTIARDLLTANDFDALVNASFLTHVHARPDEFHYCPTPDCPQVYRTAPPDTVLQCPACLTRICPNCHIEAHDGMSCMDRDIGGERLFKEWMETHDVKKCPGCKTSIERAEGCNHMTCTQCQTHICWVCMETFPKGEGIYDHMRMAHGGIGL